MKAAIIIAFALTLMTVPALGKTFTRCSLAQELNRLGVPRSELAIWTCIALHESSYRTDAVGPPNSNGSQDYGLFQINNFYWCQPANGQFSHNACKVSCQSLLSDDITKSIQCAQQVKGQQGWSAWSVWSKCSGSLPSIDECF